MEATIDIRPGEGNDAGKVSIAFGTRGVSLSWEAAKRFGRQLMRPHLFESPAPGLVDVHVLEDGHVDVLLYGSMWFNGATIDIVRIARAILQAAGAVEELVEADRIIEDQALAIRSGKLPFAFSANPKIMSEARKHARDDRTLRRALVSSDHLGMPLFTLPVVRQFSADPFVSAKERVALMTPAEKLRLREQLEKETK